ncbi:MAG: hypothetical protein ACYTEO_19285 [Planctomycetota bacterium]|jgi:hypothetical protein
MFIKIPDWLRHEIREQWSRLCARLRPARKWINQQNPKIIIVITAASVLLLLMVVIWMWPENPLKEVELSDKAWFYDLNTEQLFVGRDNQIPPIEAPSGPLPNGGPAGVKAYVLSYVDEPNESERFIAFLEILTTEAKKERPGSIKSKASGAEQWGQGRLIRRVNDKNWVPANSYQGRFILERVFRPNKNGASARYCPPE